MSVSLKGNYSYAINPNANTVSLSVDQIVNNSYSSTGTLRLELWLTTTPWSSTGANTGYEVATYRITGSSNGILGPNQYFYNITGTVAYNMHPPVGTYYVTLAVAEYTGASLLVDNGFVIDDAQSFIQLNYVDSTGGYHSIYPPVLVAQDQTIAPGASIPAGRLIASVSDPNQSVITAYEFRDNSSGGGYFTLNGVKQAAGTWIQVGASELAKLNYVGATGNGTDRIDVAAFDGFAWSAYQTANVTTELSVSVISPTSTQEGDSGTHSLTFTLSLSAPSLAPVTVQVDTSDDTARAGYDYQGVHQRVTFAPGTTTALVNVPIIGNTMFQPTRAFALSLSSPGGATLSNSASYAYGVILDDDTPAGLNLPTDDLFSYQWYLYTVRAEYAWHIATGAGIKIGIFDQGVDSSNPDLGRNDNLALGRVALTMAAGGSPVQSTDNHGTMVAGVIGAARDAQGIVGVAYDASLVSIYSPLQFATNYLNEIANAFAYAKNLDVLNNSWGFGNLLNLDTNWAFLDNANTPAFAPAFAALKDLATNGRHGLGTNVVQSAGNGYNYGDDTNLHNFQNSRYIITVGSTDFFGAISSFSTKGASILVSAPGGGGGQNFNSILTTDRSGANGERVGDVVFADGTSFSAPVVSGIVALMLQANPGLGYRDVQQILAYTAHKIDTGNGTWVSNAASDWNGGGLHFNNDQTTGFGQVDALAAVRLASAWIAPANTVANTREVILHRSVNQVIPDASSSTGARSQIQVTDTIRVERVDLAINVTHPFIGDLSIWLTSPSGTTSNLLWRPAAGALSAFGSSQDNIHFTFDTVLDWGESAAGIWTLAVYDHQAVDVGTLVDWTLDIVGKAASPSHTFIYTNEFPTLVAADPRRASLSDPGGKDDVINTGALGDDNRIDLSGMTVSVLNGAILNIVPGTPIKTAIGGAGDDVLIAGSTGNILIGMSGNDTIVGGAGADVAQYNSALRNYTVTKAGANFTVTAITAADGSDSVTNVETLQFADMRINLTAPAIAASIAPASLTRIEELYVAFFNRVPDADGLAYWVGQFKGGQSMNQIAATFYGAGIQYASLTGFSAGMSNSDFINVVYRNVLGRPSGADAGGLTYWNGQLAAGVERGELVSTILSSAHTYKGDATYGWIANLLDNKILVAQTVAVNLGLNYNTAESSIAQGMAIAAAVTPTDTSAAIKLIGVDPGQIHLG